MSAIQAHILMTPPGSRSPRNRREISDAGSYDGEEDELSALMHYYEDGRVGAPNLQSVTWLS